MFNDYFQVYSHGRTHVKEIANTGFLVSLHHCSDKSANPQGFDISWKGQVRKIYSFEEVTGSRIIVINLPHYFHLL